MVRTSGSHPGNRGSIPLRATNKIGFANARPILFVVCSVENPSTVRYKRDKFLFCMVLYL